MDKVYILDIKNNDNNIKNDFVLKVTNIKMLKDIDLDIGKNIDKCKNALKSNNLNEAYEILDIVNQFTEYGDKRFSDLNILYKLKEIILFYENMSKEDIIDSMDILLKIKNFFRFLNSQITFRYDDENAHLIEKVKNIRENIGVKDLLIDDLYKKRDISLLDFEIILKFKKAFINDKQYCDMEEIYDFFEHKVYSEIKRAIVERNIECYKSILANKYEENYYESKEFQSLVNKNDMSNYKNLLLAFDNNYLLYKFNRVHSNRQKESILIKILVGIFINLPEIYRLFVMNYIIDNKKVYLDVEELFSDVSKKLEDIRKENKANAIII